MDLQTLIIAMSIPSGVTAALEYARKIKHEQKDFLTEQGIKGIYE